MARSKVAILKVKPASVLQDIERLCQLAGLADCLQTDVPTLLKDEISWHYPFPAANTTPWQLEGTILALKRAGFHDLSCVQSESAITDAKKAEDLNNYTTLFKKHDVTALFNFKSEDMAWVEYRPRAQLRVLHRVFPEGILIPDYFFGKNVVHLPTMKCHRYTTTSGAMYSAFNGLLSAKRHYAHQWIHQALVDVLAIQREVHTGIFAVMDGTTAGNGPGPRTMIPTVKDYMLASSDSVAVDAVAAKMMGFDPMSIEYIRCAHDNGLGVGNPNEITLLGDDISAEAWGFSVGQTRAQQLGQVLWRGKLGQLNRMLSRTPLVKGINLGSELYYDYYRWPRKDRQLFERWKERTPWGELFAAYERGESERLTAS